MAESLDTLISGFLAKASPVADHPQDLLKAFVAFLKERGQFLEPGDMAKQFIEIRSVLDKNKIEIAISKCLVCGAEAYEVKRLEA